MAVSPTVRIRDIVLGKINSEELLNLSAEEMGRKLDRLVHAIADDEGIPLGRQEQSAITAALVDDIRGHGPLEPLLNDPTISDILINGAEQVYIERNGKLEMVQVKFRNDQHLVNISQRIASSVGRRIDESSPMLDARLSDGSRVNIVLAPLALRGPYVSIRKFKRDVSDAASLVQKGTLSPKMAITLEAFTKSRANTIISGGTGAGKTTLMNALSRSISTGERIVTIEDVAELQLSQPHVLPMETRPANIEGRGQVGARELVRNALRMRPDRIIVGEVRGAEAFDMLQAMNTGHNGSMTTVHANTATDALHRIENMVLMAETNLPPEAIRSQVASAIDLIIQIERMRDGVRRIISVDQVLGFEDGEILTSEIWHFMFDGEDESGNLKGRFVAKNDKPLAFAHKLQYFGALEQVLSVLNSED